MPREMRVKLTGEVHSACSKDVPSGAKYPPGNPSRSTHNASRTTSPLSRSRISTLSRRPASTSPPTP